MLLPPLLHLVFPNMFGSITVNELMIKSYQVCQALYILGVDSVNKSKRDFNGSYIPFFQIKQAISVKLLNPSVFFEEHGNILMFILQSLRQRCQALIVSCINLRSLRNEKITNLAATHHV